MWYKATLKANGTDYTFVVALQNTAIHQWTIFNSQFIVIYIILLSCTDKKLKFLLGFYIPNSAGNGKITKNSEYVVVIFYASL